MPYPMTPPRIRRFVRNIVYRRRGRTLARVSRTMRAIGAPALMNIFKRPAERLFITHDGNQLLVNGAAMSANTLTPGGTGFLGGNGFVGGAGVASNGIITNTFKAGFGQYFMWAFLTAQSDLANLYDNYRIKNVQLRIDLSFNSTPGQNTVLSASSLPILHYAVDSDDITVPASASDVLAYTKSRTVRLGDKPLYINFQPRAQGVASGATATSTNAAIVGTMLPSNTWLDCQSGAAMPHLGLKFYLENMPNGVVGTGGTSNWVMCISPVYTLECKNIH